MTDKKTPNPNTVTPPRGFNMRSMLYLLIPVSFILIVGLLILGGAERQNDPGVGETETVPLPTTD